MKATFPRLANYYLKGVISDADALTLAKWDVLVLATTEQVISQVPKIRAANPDIVILAYLSGTYTYSKPLNVTDPNVWLDAAVQDWANKNKGWLLRADGAHVSSWRDRWNVNLTREDYRDWYVPFVVKRLFTERPGVFDGVFFDNCLDRLNVDVDGIDADGDGVADVPATFMFGWQDAMYFLTGELRHALPGKFLVGNGPNSYLWMNGAMIENFPPWGETPEAWRAWMLPGQRYSALRNDSFYTEPRMNILNAGLPIDSWDGSAGAKRKFRLAFGSCLLTDNFFSWDSTPQTHSALWWMPEYDYDLGNPGGPYSVTPQGLYVRAYERAMVRVNPTGTQILNVPGMDAVIG